MRAAVNGPIGDISGDVPPAQLQQPVDDLLHHHPSVASLQREQGGKLSASLNFSFLINFLQNIRNLKLENLHFEGS